MFKMAALTLGAVLVLYAASANAQKLGETTEWIHDFVEARGYVLGSTFTDKYHVNFEGCTITVIDNATDRSCSLPENKDVCEGAPPVVSHVHTSKATLGDFDPIESYATEQMGGKVGEVFLATHNDRLAVTHVVQDPKDGLFKRPYIEQERWITVYVSSPSSANRLLKAFQHAITLCGGKPSTF